MSNIKTQLLASTPKAELSFLPKLHEVLLARLKADAMSSRACDKAQVILEEVFVNIVTHAYDIEKSGEFILEYGYENGLAKLVTLDRGRPFNPLKQPPPDLSLPLEKRPIGGLGIMLIQKMACSVHYTYENEHNRLEIVISNE